MKMKKAIAMVLAVMLIVALSVAGTIAWLMDSTETVENTFTVGNVDITLKETPYNNTTKEYGTAQVEGQDNSYPAIPGATYEKDPTVEVVANSEKCYLFVEFTYTTAADTYLNYSSNLKSGDWSQVGSTTENTTDGTKTEVWYRVVDKSTANQPFALLGQLEGKGDGITLEIDATAVTNQNMTTAAAQSLKYKAYAVQFDNVTAADGKTVVEVAWNLAKDATVYTNP